MSRIHIAYAVIPTLLAIALPAGYVYSQETYFTPLAVWTTGYAGSSFDVALGDVDGDGDLDVVYANQGESTRLYLNDGGTLRTTPAWESDPDDWTSALTLGDVDGDGDLDLICAAYAIVNVSHRLYLNENGMFQSSPVWISEPGDGTYSVVLGDIDNDGDLDLVCANPFTSNTLYLNDGGVFQTTPAWRSPGDSATVSVALGDVDNDGDLDLVCGNSNYCNTLYLNDNGMLQDSTAWSSTPALETQGVALGDIDGDGDLDLVCGNRGQGNTLYLNNGGTFSSDPDWSSVPENSTNEVVLGDVDGDGDLDIVFGNAGSQTLYLNDGGVLQTNPVWESEYGNTEGIALGDIDGDGDLDLVSANNDQTNTLHRNENSVLPVSPSWSAASAGRTDDVALADVDRDGDLDLITGSEPDGARLYLNQGGVISDSVAWAPDVHTWTRGVALGDISGNGYLDIVLANASIAGLGGSNELFYNVGGTIEVSPAWMSPDTTDSYDVALGDVDGDGDLDAIFGNYYYKNTLYLNENGILSDVPAWESSPANNTNSVALGDIDGDGDLDLVCGNRGNNTLYFNHGGTLDTIPSWSSAPANATQSIALGDVDGDGDLDLVCGNEFAVNNTMYRNVNGTFETSPAWSSGPAKSTKSVALGDVDADGDLDLACGNSYAATLYYYNRLYINRNGVLDTEPAWTSGDPANDTRGVAFGDIDDDGDFDLVCGNKQYTNTMFAGEGSPVFKGDPLLPRNHLPNNGAFLRSVEVDKIDDERYRVVFELVDIESDPVWLIPEYQYVGEPTWYPAITSGGTGRAGPFTTSPAGVGDSVTWDTRLLLFDDRDVVLRLRAMETPARVSFVQHVSPFLKHIGPVVPYRPAISTSAPPLAFATVTVGDTVTSDLVIGNAGNLVLSVNAIDLPSPEMRMSATAPFDLAPGERDTLTVYCQPRIELAMPGSVRISSNDPLRPSVDVAVTTDIRPLEVGTELLAQTGELPLGEAATVIITPAPDVRVEEGYLFYRPADGASTFADSIALSPSRTGFIAVIPGHGVTEAGLEYYIRVENSGVFATDPPGAPVDSVFSQAVAQPDGIASAPLPNLGSGYFEGLDIKVQVTLPVGAVFEGGHVFYRAGGETDYDSVAIGPGEPAPFAVIPDSVTGPTGLEYWARVETATRVLTDPRNDPDDTPYAIRITTPNLQESAGHPGMQFRMMSIPLEIDAPIAGVVTDDLGGPDPTRWRMFAYDGDGYEEVPSQYQARFEQGRGYWLITKETHRLDTGPATGVSTPTDRPFEITLYPGWNLLGDPFNFTVSWDSCGVDSLSMAEAEGAVVEGPVLWTGGSYRFDAEALEPFDGCWVKNLLDSVVTLKIPPSKAVAAPPLLAVDGVPEGDWRVEITARSGEAEDAYNIAGVSDGADNAWDRFDRSEPPRSPGSYVSLYFPHGDWDLRPGDYTVDMRGRYEPLDGALISRVSALGELWGHVWWFDVDADTQDEEGVALEFTAQGLPADAIAYVVDTQTGITVDLSSESRYGCHVSGGGDAPRFALLVGSEEFVEDNRDRLPGPPTETVLRQNVPNPFNPTTTIRYELAHASHVDLRIYDVTGALVRVLDDRDLPVGRYESVWSGTNARGEPVSSGVYFYRLVADGSMQTRKMLLLK